MGDWWVGGCTDEIHRFLDSGTQKEWPSWAWRVTRQTHMPQEVKVESRTNMCQDLPRASSEYGTGSLSPCCPCSSPCSRDLVFLSLILTGLTQALSGSITNLETILLCYKGLLELGVSSHTLSSPALGLFIVGAKCFCPKPYLRNRLHLERLL